MSLLFRIEPGFTNPGPSVNQLPTDNPSFSINMFIPRWERKTKNEGTKLRKTGVLSVLIMERIAHFLKADPKTPFK